MVACPCAIPALVSASLAEVAAAVELAKLLTVTHTPYPVRTYILLSVVLKYRAPVSIVLPSLSVGGS